MENVSKPGKSLITRRLIVSFGFIGLLFGTVLSGCSNELETQVDVSGYPSGTVIFADDFSTDDSGWQTWQDLNNSQVVYQNSSLRFIVTRVNTDIWSIHNQDFSDVRVEADAMKINGPDDNQFGLICRYQDDSNFYALVITSDGYYGIFLILDDQYRLLSGETLQYSTAVYQGDALNHIRADCIGNEISLFANDQFLVSVNDDSFTYGKSGLLVGTFASTGVDVIFDNFQIIQP